jgi:predicted amidophosphoribosyltransferase
MDSKSSIENGLAQVGDVMLCADCRKATTLFRERCMVCGHANVFTVQDVFDGRVNLSEMTSGADLNWIATVIDQLFVSVAPSTSGRIAA